MFIGEIMVETLNFRDAQPMATDSMVIHSHIIYQRISMHLQRIINVNQGNQLTLAPILWIMLHTSAIM